MDFRDDADRIKPLVSFSHSSLTDIIFLLLLYFLLTSSFVANFGIKVNIPKAVAGAQTHHQFISVAITKNGSFYVDGNRVSRDQLAQRIRQAKQNKPKKTLVLRADKQAVINDAVYVMNIAKALNLKIIMATEKESQ